jgi:regulator of protease activity HflC (stomatin/prohibitin superfamily)
MFLDIGFGLGALLVLLIPLLVSAIRVLREYERGVVFQLGRFWGVKGPGLIILIPVLQQMVRVDLRTIVLDVPTQDVISRDNVSVKVNAVLYFRVVDPERAIIQVGNFLEATSQLAQTTLRSVLGKHELDEMLAERERLNLDIQQVLDAQTDAWGIKVANVEIKHVDLDESMVRAIARQAEAERERRAKVIHAEGELQASEKLQQAALVLSQQAGAMQLRYMQTLSAIAGDKILDHRVPAADRPAGGRRPGAARRRALTPGHVRHSWIRPCHNVSSWPQRLPGREPLRRRPRHAASGTPAPHMNILFLCTGNSCRSVLSEGGTSTTWRRRPAGDQRRQPAHRLAAPARRRAAAA